MKFLSLKDNALFLRNWRERMRPAIVGSAALLTVLIVLLIFTNIHLKDEYVNQYTGHYTMDKNGYKQPDYKKILVPWPNNLVWNLAIFQGVIILLFGTFSAYKSAQQERIYGVLDFHRASPTSRADQVLGLLTGVACLEWILILGIFFLEIGLSIFYHISVFALCKFFILLSLCAVLLHSIAALAGVALNAKSTRLSAVLIFIGLYSLAGILFAEQLSCTYHMSWMPAYDQLSLALRGVTRSYWNEYHQSIDLVNHSFFGYPINSIIFQLSIQIPIIGLLLTGIERSISSTERPIFSKAQSILLILFILFILTGSLLSRYLIGTQYGRQIEELQIIIFITLILGLGGSIFATPTQALYLKGLRRAKRLNQKMSTDSDEASNFKWLIVFVMVASLFYLIVMNILSISAAKIFLGLGLLLSYIVFFASLFEYFRLSQYRKNNIVFLTIIIILWVILPLFGQIAKIFTPLEYLQYLSPFVSLFGAVYKDYDPILNLQIAFSINAPLAVIAVFLAYLQRINLRRNNS